MVLQKYNKFIENNEIIFLGSHLCPHCHLPAAEQNRWQNISDAPADASTHFIVLLWEPKIFILIFRMN